MGGEESPALWPTLTEVWLPPPTVDTDIANIVWRAERCHRCRHVRAQLVAVGNIDLGDKIIVSRCGLNN
eukprot:8889316-Prorocentrum_lima.AAC.1